MLTSYHPPSTATIWIMFVEISTQFSHILGLLPAFQDLTNQSYCESPQVKILAKNVVNKRGLAVLHNPLPIYADFLWFMRSWGWHELSAQFTRACIETIDTWLVAITPAGNLVSMCNGKYVRPTVGLLSWEPMDNVQAIGWVSEMAVFWAYFQQQAFALAEWRACLGNWWSAWNGDHPSTLCNWKRL